MIAPYRAEFVDSGAQLEGGRLVRSAHPTTAKSQPGGRGISIAPYNSHEELYQGFLSGSAIAVIIHSLDPSLISRLIARYSLA